MKALITLFGNDNTGKTAALQNVVQSMIGHLPPANDFRIVFEWRGAIVYLSTYGDDAKVIKRNIDFFNGIITSCGFYFFMNNTLTKCTTKKEKAIVFGSYKPTILVSASRSGEKTLGELRSFAENHMQLKANVAIQKVKTPKGYNNVVQPIIDLIDKLK